ncbi:DEAD/DEAH box helicase [Chondromyces crocatus]|uniref:DEAD/DEAH box helicase n=1 Tax=Chondromyces crocatus TaxID=52 RepID=UPI00147037A7|nr:DEAD/DEAH box helicase [Chondromyces crocatus]
MKKTRRSERSFYAKWTLPDCRKEKQLDPAPHQAVALRKLDGWYGKLGQNQGGGILVLPTGGGKTFTAVRFLCAGPLSDGYKVLWLAHTHHLLEQAFHSFKHDTLGSIREPRRELSLRVVSGTPGHYPPRDILPKDDVVIATLQTITNAFREQLSALVQFIKAAGKKLFIVFDEAHHAPAPSYRNLLEGLRAKGAPVLGLTATPVYSDERKQGWLKKLFPDGILAQTRASELIASGVLARPKSFSLTTRYTPSFEGADYEKWLGTYRDIPEYVVDALANSAERNGFIAKTYADERKKWGKTIIFTDRWYQCEAIAEALKRYKVKAGSVYSHVDASPATVALRKERDSDTNARVLESFRKNEIQVLINVRMLTEGTDVPDVQTVFLTRQTTSRILLTQMVGRALRGPKFKGTEEANIVSFEDDWREQVQWAEFELEDGSADDKVRSTTHRPPLQLISIDLVKQLARQMADGANVTPVPFQALMPVGWYKVTFDARVDGSDDIEPQELLVMVFEDEIDGFKALIKSLTRSVPEPFGEESVTLEDHRESVESWRAKFLSGARRNPVDLQADLLLVARHIAQQQRTAPPFFPFEMRAEHDVDKLAIDFIESDLGPRAIDEKLRAEYARSDRFWRTLFHRYEQLRHFYDGCQVRILEATNREADPETYRPPTPDRGRQPSVSEPDEHVKKEVLKRDNRACLACGSNRTLQVDHIIPVYHAGSHEPDNLQTLCKRCNGLKGTRTIRFTSASTQLTHALTELPLGTVPNVEDAANPDQWGRFFRQTFNFFYQCGAVGDVTISSRGAGYYDWAVTLRSGNNPAWLAPHLEELVDLIQSVREKGRKPPIRSLRIRAPGQRDLVYPN